MLKKLMLAAALIVSLVSTLGVTPATLQDDDCIRGWWNTVDELVTDFLDTREVAGLTPRGALSPILLQLFRDYRAFERVDTPPCAISVKGELELGMLFSISGIEYFMSEDSDSGNEGSSDALDSAETYFQSAAAELEEIDAEYDGRMD